MYIPTNNTIITESMLTIGQFHSQQQNTGANSARARGIISPQYSLKYERLCSTSLPIVEL